MRKRLAMMRSAQATVIGLLVLLPGAAVAAAFSAGDVVVYRVGDGSASLVNTGSPVFLDEYTPGGTLVQSIALPTTASGSSNQLIASGTANSEGLLTRSADGRYLLLTGYARDLGGGTSLSGTAATTVPRTVGRVKYDGTIDTSTALSDFASGNNPRSAASSDGLDIWVAGAAGGVRYTRYSAFGSTTSTQLSTTNTNLRQVDVAGGQLYVSTQNGTTIRVGTVGSGTPTTSGQTITNLPGIPATITPNGLVFVNLPGGAVLYVADESTGGGQIQKYSLASGSWTANGTIAAAAARGVTAAVSGSVVNLYATTGGNTASGGGTLYTFVDTTGYNATVSGTAGSIASAATNEAFRGVALAPLNPSVATPTPTGINTATPLPTSPTTPTQAATTATAATETPAPSLTPTAVVPGTSTATRPAAAASPTATATSTATPASGETPVGQPFTHGNLVVYRVGDGTATLTANGNAVFVDEYTPDGSLVQSIPLPTMASGVQQQLIADGIEPSEGLIARSTDERYIMLTGYGADLGGAAALPSTTGTTVPRVVGRVKYDGTIDTSTALSDFSNANNPRSATSTNGTDIWVGGAGKTDGGVHYTTLGATTSTQLFASIPKGVRQVNIFGGQLYFDSNATGFLNVSAIGSGTPTTGGQIGSELAGLPDSAGNDGYFFADLGDGHGVATLYVANDSQGAILKYSLVDGSWSAQGTITAASVHGVTGVVSSGSVTLYATGTAGTDGYLYSFTDTTGYNVSVSGTAATLAIAPANEAFRGLALAPLAATVPTPTGAPTPPTATPNGATPTGAPTEPVPATNTPSVTAAASRTATASPSATPTAAAFAPGNVVVYRVGDGTAALSSAGYAVFLDEYTPAGTLVQSVALPTAADGSNQPLIASGTAGTEGQLTRSVNGQYLMLTGYDAALGTGNPSKSTLPRTVGRVDYAGRIDTTTALTDFSIADKPRSAASTNGIDIWLSCGGKATGGSDGVRYTTLGSTTSTQVSITFGDGREVNIFDGQLYLSSQSGSTILIGTVGTGTPTTAGQTTTALPGFVDDSGKPEGFFLADLDGTPGVDTLYVADETAGIQKWSLVSGAWTLNDAIAPAADVLYGVTGVVTGTTVTLYATGSTGSNDGGTLYTLTDSGGYNGSLSGVLTALATAAANEAFRGVALAPMAATSPSPTTTVPSVTSATPRATDTPTPGRTVPPTRTPTASASPNATPTGTAVALPTATPIRCVGDCDGSGDVTVDEIVRMANIALGTLPLSDCAAGDGDGSGDITVNEIVAAVSHALNGCPAA